MGKMIVLINFFSNFVSINMLCNVSRIVFMRVYYIGLGSNIGEKKCCLQDAIDMMGQRVGKIVAVSSFYETEAEGFVSENRFVNAVAEVHSTMTPHEVLLLLQQIERDMGCYAHRNEDGTYCDRMIDLDIIACDDVVCDDDILTLPHPRMHQRRFVLEPLCEIAPEWIHPHLHLSAIVLLQKLPVK